MKPTIMKKLLTISEGISVRNAFLKLINLSSYSTFMTSRPFWFEAWELRKKTTIAVSAGMILLSLQGHGQAISPKATATGPLVAGKISPASQTIGYNTFPAALTSTLPTGGNGSYSYQWQSSPNGSTWMNVPDAKALTYVPPALRATTYYRLVSVSSGSKATSSAVVVNVKNKD